MPFSVCNIDRAIVMTQYDLHGFYHPFGFRIQGWDPKGFEATTANFMSFAAGVSKNDFQKEDIKYISYFESSYREYLEMCEKLSESCDLSQKEAIKRLIKSFVRKNKRMRSEVASGKRKKSAYLLPLKKSNRWGKAVLALAKAFEVKIQSE